MSFQVIRHDITKVKADAIVNTANPEPIYGSGVDQAIYMAAGEKELLAERIKIGKIKPGTVAVTPAFNLQAEYIIHTVGPCWVDGKSGEAETLKSCYSKSLKKAYSLKCKSIAFPLISTGVYGFPKDLALQIAMSELQEFAMHHKMQIYLVIFDADSFELTGQIFDDIKAYIDDNYVDATHADEYQYYRNIEARALSEHEKLLRRRAQMEHHRGFNSSSKAITFGEIFTPDIDDFEIPENSKTFQEKLFEYIDASGMKDTEVYKGVMSRAGFSKIRCNRFYQPARTSAIIFCLRLKLDINKTEDMLSRAGFAFNPTNKADVVVKAFIVHNNFDINLVDTYLMKLQLPTLLNYGDNGIEVN